MEVWVVGAATPHQTRLQKKVYHAEVRTILVTSIKLYCKNYLKFSYTLNSPTLWSRKSLTVLAIAIFKNMVFNFKKINHSAFVTLTDILLFVTSMFHSTESPCVNSKILTTSFGTPTLREFEFGLAIPTLDLYLNIIIPLVSFYIVINMLVKLYKIILLKSNLKSNLYILVS